MGSPSDRCQSFISGKPFYVRSWRDRRRHVIYVLWSSPGLLLVPYYIAVYSSMVRCSRYFQLFYGSSYRQRLLLYSWTSSEYDLRTLA